MIWLLGLRGLANDLLELPPLPPAERPGLDDGDGVARPGLVLLVVHHEGRRAPLGLAVQAVPHVPLDGHDNALLHLVAEDDAVLFRLLGHVCSQRIVYWSRFCLRTVLRRARSRRTVRSLSGASSCPMDFWMRILNS